MNPFFEELRVDLLLIDNYESYNLIETLNNSMTPDISEKELLEHIAITCFSFVGMDCDFDKLATKYYLRFMSYDMDKQNLIFSYQNVIEEFKKINIISDEYIHYCNENMDFINELLINKQNYELMNFFGLKTLEKLYLLKTLDGRLIEMPNDMYLRVAIQIHIRETKNFNIQNNKIKETYKLLSNLYYTHATPTYISSGLKEPQLSSCFLMQCPDSIDGITKSVSDMAKISKYGGGIGINISDVRGKGARIKSNNGMSDGILPLSRFFQTTMKYFNQRSVRNGSAVIYIEPWHSDIYTFLDLRRISGSEEERARDIFLGLWIPDLFMECVENDLDWYLMTPDVCLNLTNTIGDDFKKLYYEYVEQNMYVKKIRALDLFNKIMEAQFETGMPYMLYKDACNKKSNQQNLGVIKNSNLCAEIIQYSDETEIACCNLASISLPKFVINNSFDFDSLGYVVSVAVENLNSVIDINFYPVPETKTSNMKHRPIGLGVQGLADVFLMLNYAFDSEEAFKLNKKIFECIYYYSLKTSILIAQKDGAYESFENSPFSKGILQFHLWGLDHSNFHIDGYPDFEWDEIILKIPEGIRNSVITALMPTASTSQTTGNYECFEPYTTNIFVRKVGVREFIVVNKHLVRELKKLNLWNEKLYYELIYNGGSVQKLSVPNEIKNKYKTASELKQIVIIKQAIDRGAFVDQTQSMNVFISEPDYEKLKKLHLYAWKHGLKTGMYYLRSGIKMGYNFGIDPNLQNEFKNKYNQECDEECTMCSA
jgi:ribonucleoside-diphosphate reductase alpha subunit